MYLTFDEYEEMGGTLDETTFNDFSYEADAIINWYTFNRLKKDTEFCDELKYCVFRIIKLAQLKQEALSLGNSDSSDSSSPSVMSQSNDGVSISYNVLSASDLLKSISKDEIESLIKMYLVDVRNQEGRRVLYRGLYPNE